MGWVQPAQDAHRASGGTGLTPEAIAFWENIAAAGGGDTAGGGLSLGGDGTGFSQPNSVYNQMTGQYIPVGGTDNLNPDFGKYKQHVYLGTEHGTVWLPEGVSSADFLANPDAYQTVDNADGFSRTVVGEGGTPINGTPTNGTIPDDTGWGIGRDPNVPPITNMPLDPDLNNPTNDWPEYDDIGYGNVPPPKGDGEFVEGGPPADTSWDWNYFREKAPGDRQWGGYDEDYQAFERYQPGMDSPWGMPNIRGGNEDFYQQQFVNQLRDEQGFRNRQRAAQMRKQDALENPYEAPSAQEMWKWAYGGAGLPEVKLGTGKVEPSSYSLNENYAGMDAGQIWDNAQNLSTFTGGTSSKQDRELLNNFFSNNNRAAQANAVDWSKFNSPQEAMAAVGDTNWFQGMNRANAAENAFGKLINQIYTAGALGPTAPVGYASPIQWGSDYNSYAAGTGE